MKALLEGEDMPESSYEFAPIPQLYQQAFV